MDGVILDIGTVSTLNAGATLCDSARDEWLLMVWTREPCAALTAAAPPGAGTAP